MANKYHTETAIGLVSRGLARGAAKSKRPSYFSAPGEPLKTTKHFRIVNGRKVYN